MSNVSLTGELRTFFVPYRKILPMRVDAVSGLKGTRRGIAAPELHPSAPTILTRSMSVLS